MHPLDQCVPSACHNISLVAVGGQSSLTEEAIHHRDDVLYIDETFQMEIGAEGLVKVICMILTSVRVQKI